MPIATGIKYLQWLSNASASFPQAGPNKPHFIGHGTLSGTGLLQSDTEFQFGLCKYLMVTSSVRYGWYLANNGYGIDQGLLEQPASVYDGNDGIGCGEPTAPFKKLNANVLERTFEKGTVSLHYLTETCRIDCGPTPPVPPPPPPPPGPCVSAWQQCGAAMNPTACCGTCTCDGTDAYKQCKPATGKYKC